MTQGKIGAWVQAPLIQRILRELVKSAEELNLSEKFAPELHDTADPEAADFAWAQLDEAVALGWFELAFRKNVRVDNWSRARRRPYLQAHAQTRQMVLEHCQDAACVEAHQRLAAWRDALDRHQDLTDEQRRLLINDPIGGWTGSLSPEKVIEALLAFKRQPDFHLFQREASARHFWGISKLIKDGEAFFKLWLEVGALPYREAKAPLLVQLPARRLSGILFIENLTTYESTCELVRSRTLGMTGPDVFSELALVYSQGNQAVGSIRHGMAELRPSVADAGKPFAASWLSRIADELCMGDQNLPVYFWGDLDLAGMRMLESLTKHLPHARAWWPGYAPMVAALLQGNGHEPLAADKEGQACSELLTCPVAKTHLMPAMKSTGRFLDQEFVDLKTLEEAASPAFL